MCEHFKKEIDYVTDNRYGITYTNKETLIEDNRCGVCMAVCSVLEHFDLLDRKKEIERSLEIQNKARDLLANKYKDEDKSAGIEGGLGDRKHNSGYKQKSSKNNRYRK